MKMQITEHKDNIALNYLFCVIFIDRYSALQFCIEYIFIFIIVYLYVSMELQKMYLLIYIFNTKLVDDFHERTIYLLYRNAKYSCTVFVQKDDKKFISLQAMPTIFVEQTLLRHFNTVLRYTQNLQR